MKYSIVSPLLPPISKVILGSVWFGMYVSEDVAFNIMDTYIQQGGTMIDTAHTYANWVPNGEGKSETTIGKWLVSRRPKDVLIGSKGAVDGMSRSNIRTQLSESLDRLRREKIDFYWLHRDDPSVPVGEIMEWLNELVQEKRIVAYGCSNWSCGRIDMANQYAKEHGLAGFGASQNGWSLAVANPAETKEGLVYMDESIMNYHLKSGLPFFAYSSQAQGFFSAKYDRESVPVGVVQNAKVLRFYASEENHRRRNNAVRMAKEKGVTVNQIALAYLLNHPFPVFPIVGSKAPAQLIDSCQASEIVLTREEVAALNAV